MRPDEPTVFNPRPKASTAKEQPRMPDSLRWFPENISRLVRMLARFFQPREIMPAESVDRDAERVAREIEMIRIRFPHRA